MTVLALFTLVWRRLRHDRLALAFTFLLPVTVAMVMVGIYTDDDSSVGVFLVEDGAVAEGLVGRMEADPSLAVQRYRSRDALERAVRRREMTAGVVVPAGIGAGERTTVELLGPPETEAPGGVRARVEAAVAETAAALQLGRVLAPDGPADVALAAGTSALAAPTSQPADGSGDEGAGRRSDSGRADQRRASAAEALVATLVLFVFMNAMGTSSWLPDLRDLGILARARTSAASPTAIAAGYGLGMTSYAFVQAMSMLAAGQLVFGIVWASWPALLTVTLAVALAAGALGVVTGSILPAAAYGATVAGPVGFLLAALGGAVWPLDLVNGTLQTVGHLTPQAWAVEALHATGASGRGLTDVGVQIGILGAAALGLTLVGGRRIRQIARQA